MIDPNPEPPPPASFDPACVVCFAGLLQDKEEVVDLNSLLLPDGQWPQGSSRFAVSCNNGLLKGWVKQPSPCCAAASVAGALNALKGVERGSEGSLDHLAVLQVMAGLVDKQVIPSAFRINDFGASSDSALLCNYLTA